jgi:hypothetical protein
MTTYAGIIRIVNATNIVLMDFSINGNRITNPGYVL